MLPGNLLHPLKLDVVGFKEEDHDYHFRVELPEPKCCQSCGAAEGRVVRFGKDDQAYRDVPIHNKRVTIWMIRRRYKCHDCGSTFRPELKDMDDRRMMTKRLVKHIEVGAVLGNNSDVARTVGVDEKTVRLIFEDYYKAKDAAYKPKASRVLGIDELLGDLPLHQLEVAGVAHRDVAVALEADDAGVVEALQPRSALDHRVLDDDGRRRVDVEVDRFGRRGCESESNEDER